MSEVADITLRFIGTFARVQWQVDYLADRGGADDQALRDALSRRTDADKFIEKADSKPFID